MTDDRPTRFREPAPEPAAPLPGPLDNSAPEHLTPEDARKWRDIDPEYLAWRRELVDRRLREERLDQWIEYGFRLLQYVIVVGALIVFVWLGKYAVDHHAPLRSVPVIGGGVAGLAGAVLAVRNRRR